MTQITELEEHFRQTLKMYRLTRNELVNTYWQQIDEIANNGFVPFIFRGALCWESLESKQIQSQTGSVWLKSDYYDPIGKPITDEPVKVYLQWYLNFYQISGGIRAEVASQDEKVSKDILEQTIQDIYLLCNLISLTTGASISWYPARFAKVAVKPNLFPPSQEQRPSYVEWRCIPLQRKQEEQITTCVKDDYFKNELFPLFEHIRNVKSKELEALLRRSIAWYATGNFLGSGLNRFLNYWESIELLVHFFYRRLPLELTGRPSKLERKNQIQSLVQQVTHHNCLQIARQCAEIVLPSAKAKMQCILPALTGRSDSANVLFTDDAETGISLYQIRNDIAHGNYCDHNLEFTELVERRLQDMRLCSRAILSSTLHRVEILMEQIERTETDEEAA